MYEYKVITVTVKKAEDELNALARENWRVIAVSPNMAAGFGLVATLEREHH